jgi:WD40 repeat protein
MISKILISSLIVISLNLLVSTLQHEKSFMFDRTATAVLDLALYNRSLLITSSNDVVQVDIETGSFQRRFIAHLGKVETILVVNSSKMITSGGDDMVIVWDLISGSILRRIWLEATNTFPKSIQLAENNLFVCGSDGFVRIVDMISGRVDQTVGNFKEVCLLVFRCKCCCVCYCS